MVFLPSAVKGRLELFKDDAQALNPVLEFGFEMGFAKEYVAWFVVELWPAATPSACWMALKTN